MLEVLILRQSLCEKGLDYIHQCAPMAYYPITANGSRDLKTAA